MRRSRVVALAVLPAAAALVYGLTAVQALQVRSDLLAAQRDLTTLSGQVRSGGSAASLTERLPALQHRLRAASQRTHNPLWAVAEHIPAGGNLRRVRGVAEALAELGDHGLPALVAADRLLTGGVLHDGAVDLGVLGRLRGQLALADRAATTAGHLLVQHPSPLTGPVLTQVSTPAALVNRQLADLQHALTGAVQSLDVAPALLGQDGPRTYLVAVQNDAEARATGGLIGAFAVVRADRGRLTLRDTGTDDRFQQQDKPVVVLPGAAQTWQDIGSTRAWFDANLTPHYPDAAQSIAGLWRAQSRETVDGVLSLDPVVMAALLQGSPPLTLARGVQVDAGSVEDFVGHREYVEFPDNAVRKPLLSALAAQIFRRVTAGRDTRGALRSLMSAASSGHLFLWSRHPDEEHLLAGSLVGGVLPPAQQPYLSVLTQNYGGNKLDFYLRRTVTVRALPHRRLAVTIELRNTAPLGLPLYMTVRSDQPRPPPPYGQARVGLAVYGAGDSQLSEATVDGAPVLLTPDRDHGHAFGTATVEVPRGRPVTIALIITEPAGQLLYRQQPLVVADTLHLSVPHRILGK